MTVRPSDFPHSFRQVDLESKRCVFEMFTSLPPAQLVTNVDLFSFEEDGCVVIRLQDGQWQIPGGTLEPD